ncbi:MAG: penicillin-binding protein 1A [Alphaproteobacteria bacterium]
MRFFIRLFLFLTVLGLFGAALAGGGAVYALWHYGRALPDYKQLADYAPPTVTRLHAGDGRLIAEYATERRVFVPVAAMPRLVVNAFIAAEDQNFYSHPGIDFVALVRAVVTNIVNYANNRRPVGASTITQQVAKNFLLTNEVSLERKVKEAILAFRIERALSKDRILELYLNEIYLGYGSYGVAAAALNYFNKSMDELTTAEAAYLAALPKAPNNYHPIRRADAARDRRNWVIGRMLEEGFITAEAAANARIERLAVMSREATQFVQADFFVEEVRRELIERYGESGLYEGGLSVRTTLNSHLQNIADDVLRSGLIEYDRRHGWRGPLTTRDPGADWLGRLRDVTPPVSIGSWRMAMVRAVDAKGAEIGLADASKGIIPLSELTWARPWQEGQKLGPSVKRPADVLAPGDVILVEALPPEKGKDGEEQPLPHGASGRYGLRQIPDIQGGIVALDPHTGRVLALSGGYDFAASEFNRATQAQRQTGSAFKPFIYLAALEKGYKPTTRILDAPFVMDQGPGLGKWKPANYSNQFYGPSPMRLGLEKSRNLMTVRLARAIGMDTVSDYAQRFRIVDNMPEHLSMALGAAETTLLRLTTAYAMLVNGGKRITPTFIDRIQDRNGRTTFRHDVRPCDACTGLSWAGQSSPRLPDLRERVAGAAASYQIVSMLEGVVERGTARRVSAVGKPLAGKTGTTNDEMDSWFVGFSPDLAVGVFAGFDNPRPLGRQETGSAIAAPIFRDFMARALEDKPAIPFRVPPDIRLVRIDLDSGRPARPGDKHVILEAFRSDNAVEDGVEVIDGSDGAYGLYDPGISDVGGKY